MSRRATILLVDDNEDVHIICKKYLESCSFNVLSARNGESGLYMFRTNHVDLIVLDYLMPQMDGLKFCQNLTTNWHTLNTPIIVLTSLSEDQILKKNLLPLLAGYNSEEGAVSKVRFTHKMSYRACPGIS